MKKNTMSILIFVLKHKRLLIDVIRVSVRRDVEGVVPYGIGLVVISGPSGMPVPTVV